MIFGKKSIRFLFICIGFFLVLKAGFLAGQADLLDFCKSGPIHLEQDPEFGKDTDWKNLFYHLFCDIVAAPDGSLFIASSRQHTIYKFDPDGNLMTSFGQEGQGPGDFNMPGDLSVLDGKLLVVGEYALSHKISLIDFDGNVYKVLKTSRPPYRPIALRDDKIAYIVHNYRGEGPTDRKKIESVVIRDIKSDDEIKVAEFTFNMASLRIGQMSYSFGESTSGSFFIASSYDGNLIVGNSLSPFFDIFSPDGSKISTIPLNMEPIPVTKKLIGEYKKYHIDQMNRNSRSSQDRFQETLKQFKKASWDHLFAENLPYYLEVLVDTEGNLVVFNRTDCLGDCTILIQVYSPEGEFICETELVEGAFDLTVDPRIKKHVFHRSRADCHGRGEGCRGIRASRDQSTL
jgi:hypothetical protein